MTFKLTFEALIFYITYIINSNQVHVFAFSARAQHQVYNDVGKWAKP
jgi:hypothetical protein